MPSWMPEWLKDVIREVWEAFAQFMSDLFLLWLEHTLTMIVWVFDHVPALPFLEGNSLGSILGQAGPTVGWLVVTFRIGEGLAVISAAMTFYIVRRLLTLGIW